MSAPRWKIAIEQALSKNDKTSTTYALSTIDRGSVPRVRHVVHRAFTAPKSESKPLLLTTTDIRAHKVEQLLSNPQSEIAWWMRDTNEQFRITCKTYIVPSPENNNNSKCLEAVEHLASSNFDWEAERRQRFDDMSPIMRASWARPPPGSPIPSYEEGLKWPSKLPKIGEGKTDDESAQIKFALCNFALVMLDPFRVDWVELSTTPQRRTIFSRKEGAHEWEEQIVVP